MCHLKPSSPTSVARGMGARRRQGWVTGDSHRCRASGSKAWRRQRWSYVCLLFALVSVVGCAPPTKGPAPSARVLGEPIHFVFGTTEGDLFDSESTLGRATAVLFVTTFDLASQAQARYLNEVVREHRPRANAGAVVLEPPKHRVLAEAFRTSLELVYPVALANPATLSGDGPFGRIDGVPTLVILDRSGRPVFRSTGAVTKQRMKAALRAADRGRGLPNR